MSDKFALLWNDFQSNAANNFSKLRTSSDFKDVTLVGDDHKLISAHKVILSSSSEYFKNILIQHEHSHPLICIDGLNSDDIENVLDFIYTGALHIFQEDVDRFLKISEKFKLEGLFLNQDDVRSNNSILEKERTYKEDDSTADVEEILQSVDGTGKSLIKIHKNDIGFSSDDFQNIEELNSKINENVQRIDNGTKCIICGRIFKKTVHAKEHVEGAHIEGLQFQCNFCNKTYRNRKCLRNHKNNVHE